MLQKLQNIEFGHEFVILDQIEASNLYTCVKKSTSEEFVCKVCDSFSIHFHGITYCPLFLGVPNKELQRKLIGILEIKWTSRDKYHRRSICWTQTNFCDI